MANYINTEMTEKVFMYGKAEGNPCEVQYLYHAAFPLRALPEYSVFSSLFQRLWENGEFSAVTVEPGHERTECVDAEPVILELVEEESGSVRRLAYRIGVSPFIL
ncbi:hypothetical protein Zmor_006438 [Zophobas morio]|uniref:Uncharacterized protein n=1 Tax=Zophobas morio TaxID=2755281 RepID=A0AA38IW09_9CUCU|nr:hypothetical protein Zmor_006438 [Zophobas morio]